MNQEQQEHQVKAILEETVVLVTPLRAPVVALEEVVAISQATQLREAAQEVPVLHLQSQEAL
jgi:hypothetical protein